MASGAKAIQFDEFAQRLSDIFDQLEAQGEQVTVERDGKLFTLRSKRRRVRKPMGLTATDPLLGIIGLGGILDPSGPTDVSANKHKYLAEAAADLHRESARPDTATSDPAKRGFESEHDAEAV